ncbi:uncharacterized protein JN550_013133 [Neoarthrinium moseri]|uniref:uncharacterized protein n=1 Tax=Neoarthrinium moseri TaxID=1658444 RepID=UPI001FDE0833|nr:uncharacterized protein JN550_013133 [Neoarthrinium moseri]KAI1857621.1 hypothetical protein JN550_013133 [Neoarthrinium moseri]
MPNPGGQHAGSNAALERSVFPNPTKTSGLLVAIDFTVDRKGYYDPRLRDLRMMPQPHRPRRGIIPVRLSRGRESSTSTAITRPRRSPLSPLTLLLYAAVFISGVLSDERDPVADFCRRFGHQTAVVDRKLYIDGGFINYSPLPDNPTNYTNTFLSYQDLDHNGFGGMPQLYSNLSKNATIPSVNGGILWADDVNKKFYLFGGEYYQTPPNELALYEYDTLNNDWNIIQNPPLSLNSPSYGAGVSVSDLGEAYYYGGWLSNNSVPNWTGPRMATTGLINYSMDQNQWSNMTGPDNIGRAEGAMVYVPVSDSGMLIYFGGVQANANGTITGQPMDQIFAFDIASSKWYTQRATGEVPAMRSKFCAGVTWASDQSSFNVYLYGGAGMPPNTSGFDDVYILSMPSFTWIKMYPANSTLEQYPHNTLTCNVIDNAQMLIIGGTFPLDDQTCDSPEQFGTHGLDLGEQNPDESPWYLYRRNLTHYVVPSLISSVIGGNAQGAATKTSPQNGFDTPDLKILMARRFTAPVRAPTRVVSPTSTPPASTSLSNGAIAGIAVGAAVGLTALLLGAWLCLRRRRQQDKDDFSKMRTSSVAPMRSNTYSQGGSGLAWSPDGSLPASAPVSPTYGPGQYGGNPWLQQPPSGGPPLIPNYPQEMPANIHETGVSEIYDQPPPPVSATGTGSFGSNGPGSPGFVVSPYSAAGGDPTKSGNEYGWPSPVREGAQPPPPPPAGLIRTADDGTGNVYAAGGFGPQELSTEPPHGGEHRGSSWYEEGRRHETYYHR